MPPARLEIAHTSDIDPRALEAARALMADVFEGDFGADDWEHALGGMHVLVWEGSELIGHGAVVQRRLLHDGRALRCGYIEAVGVRVDRRRRGHASAIMAELERIVRSAYDLGALGASDDGLAFYRTRGWQIWAGETYVLSPDGLVRTAEDDGAVMVLPGTPALDLSGTLTCDWREGDVW